MNRIEERLRRDLPELADALIAHSESTPAAANRPSTRPTGGRAEAATRARPTEPSAHDEHRRPRRLVAASLFVAAMIAVGGFFAVGGRSGDTALVSTAALDEAATTNGASRTDPPKTLAEARVRWTAEGPDDYRFQLEIVGGNPYHPLDIEVRGSTARLLETPAPPDGIELPAVEDRWIATVEDLFVMVDTALPSIVPTFDPEFGYPTTFRVDQDPNRTGDEQTVKVSRLASLAEIEAANQQLVAWLPAPSPLPVFVRGSSILAGANDVYWIHEAGPISVGLVPALHEWCLLWTATSPPDDDITRSSTTCRTSATQIRDDGLSTRFGGGASTSDQHDFFALLPATHHAQPWTVDVSTTRSFQLSTTEHTLLVRFDAGPEPFTPRIEIECVCGDLVYEPRLR